MKHFLYIAVLAINFFCYSCNNNSTNEVAASLHAQEIAPQPVLKNVKNPAIVNSFNQLNVEPSSKELFYSQKWKAWLMDSKKIESSYESYDDYKKSYPLQVTVDARNAFLQIVDEGTGGWRSVQTATYFENSNGELFLARTKTEYTPENTDCKISINQQTSNGWKDITRTALPNIQPNRFFKYHKQTAAQYPLVTIDYLLPKKGTRIAVTPKINYFYFCENDVIMATDGKMPEEIEAICAAWENFESTALNLKWDKQTSTFKY